MIKLAKKLFVSKLQKDALRKARTLEELRTNPATLPNAIHVLLAEILVLEQLIKNPSKNLSYLFLPAYYYQVKICCLI